MNGSRVTLSGNDLVRLFNVESNVSFTIINLSLAHGNDVGAAGDGQTPGEDGYGGAVFLDGGVLHATNCRFIENRANNLKDWSLQSTDRTDTNGLFVITNFYSGSSNPTFLRVVKP